MSQGPENKQADAFLDLWERNVLAWWRDSAGLLFPSQADEPPGREDRPEAAGAAHGDGGGGLGRRGGSGRGGTG